MTYILAEIASAHMGDPDKCIELIHKAKEAGADGVKVQVWYEWEGNFAYMKDKQMTPEQHSYYLDRAPRGFDLWGQYYGEKSEELCRPYCDRLIDGRHKVCDVVENRNRLIIGKQEYPTPYGRAKIAELRKDYAYGYADHTAAEDLKFRYVIPAMAIAAGAKLIEKHICLNREELKKVSKDWVSALEPHEFKEFVQFIREAETAL